MTQSQELNTGGSLPAILCLHAYGTNVAIFRYQLRHITQALSDVFRFVFIEAPFHVQRAGPGALPAFADARPFRRWHSDKTLANAFGVSAGNLDHEVREVRTLLRDTLELERERGGDKGGPGVVGIMAFSQGAALGTALCLDPELGTGIKFAVIFCALYPALSLADDDGTGSTKLSSSSQKGLVQIPSIHVQGTSDPYKGQGTKTLQQYYDSATTKKFVFTGLNHEVPSRSDEVALVVDEIRGVWKTI